MIPHPVMESQTTLDGTSLSVARYRCMVPAMSGLLRSARPCVVALLAAALVVGINGFEGAIHSVHHSLVPGVWPALAAAHGLAGKRFFPSTLTIDDPFVSDELSLPTFFHIKQPGDSGTPPGQVTSLSGEFSKRIFPDLGLTLAGDWNLLDPAPNSKTESGTGNLEMTLKYQFFTSAAHETILSVAFGWEAGGTGRQTI